MKFPPQAQLQSELQNTQSAIALQQFFTGWIKREWADIATVCQKTWLSKSALIGGDAKAVELLLMPRLIQGWAVSEYQQVSDTAIAALVSYRYLPAAAHQFESLVPKTQSARVMVICETAAYTPHVDGAWGVNPLSALGQGQPKQRKKSKGFQ